mmetsp:Transcript_19893/g.55420  ORF Transcript_19893/g.55420 Transcript_19893/m.55420 type:complete len:157 (-) Transcript_19893:85-555(-)
MDVHRRAAWYFMGVNAMLCNKTNKKSFLKNFFLTTPIIINFSSLEEARTNTQPIMDKKRKRRIGNRHGVVILGANNDSNNIISPSSTPKAIIDCEKDNENPESETVSYSCIEVEYDRAEQSRAKRSDEPFSRLVRRRNTNIGVRFQLFPHSGGTIL